MRIRVERVERIEGDWEVRLEELERKVELMENKAKLEQKNWGVSIADDHMERQREVQKWLECEAEAWRGSRVRARMEYMKMCIDGTWLTWDEQEGEPNLVKEIGEKVKQSFRNRRNEGHDRE